MNPFDDHKLFENVSPVALFVVNRERDLKVVAIQKHYTPGDSFFALFGGKNSLTQIFKVCYKNVFLFSRNLN